MKIVDIILESLSDDELLKLYNLYVERAQRAQMVSDLLSYDIVIYMIDMAAYVGDHAYRRT